MTFQFSHQRETSINQVALHLIFRQVWFAAEVENSVVRWSYTLWFFTSNEQIQSNI